MGNIRVIVFSLILILSVQLSLLGTTLPDELKNESILHADSEPVLLATASDSYHVYAQDQPPPTSIKGQMCIEGQEWLNFLLQVVAIMLEICIQNSGFERFD